MGGHHAEVLAGFHGGRRQGLARHEHVIGRTWVRPRHHARVQSGMRLRIEIDEADPPASACQSHCEVDGRGGLANATLLIGHGDGAHENLGA